MSDAKLFAKAFLFTIGEWFVNEESGFEQGFTIPVTAYDLDCPAEGPF